MPAMKIKVLASCIDLGASCVYCGASQRQAWGTGVVLNVMGSGGWGERERVCTRCGDEQLAWETGTCMGMGRWVCGQGARHGDAEVSMATRVN